MGLTLLCLLCPSLILNSGICLPLKTFKKKDLCVWLFCVHGCLGTFCLPVALRSPNGEVRRGHWNLRTGVPGDCEPPLGYGNLIWVLWKSGQLNLIRPQQLSHHFSSSPPQHRFTFIVFSYVFVGVHVHLYRLSWSHECWIDLLLDSLEL